MANQTSAAASGFIFPREFRSHWYDQVDIYFWGYVGGALVLVALLINLLGSMELPEPSEKDILEMQDKLAILVLKKPPPKEEPKPKEEPLELETEALPTVESSEPAPEGVQEQRKQEVTKRRQATAEEIRAARQAQRAGRRAARRRVAQRAAAVGVFQQLAVQGGTGSGAAVAGISSASFTKDLGSALSGLSGIKSGGKSTAQRRRGGRATGGGNVGIDALVSGVGGGVGAADIGRAGVDLALAGPAQIEGAGKANISRSQKAIQTVVKANIGAVRHCYTTELRRKPNLAGKVTVRFVIAANGRVTKIDIRQNTTGSNTLASCIKRRIRRWKFDPIATEEGETPVTYTFPFSPG